MSYTDTDFEKPAAASHTPGPWQVNDRFYVITSTPTPQFVADCATDSEEERDMATDAANAALIAAAPDLLAALKKCESVLSSLIDTAGSLNCDRLALKSARAAIAQAEGRTP